MFDIIFICLIWYTACAVGKKMRMNKAERKRSKAIEEARAEREARAEERNREKLARLNQREAARGERTARRIDEARTIAEHYTEARTDQLKIINDIKQNRAKADNAGNASAVLRCDRQLMAAKEKLFQIERKLEKADYILSGNY